METAAAPITRYVAKCPCGAGNAVDVAPDLRAPTTAMATSWACQLFWTEVNERQHKCRSCGRTLVTWAVVKGRYSENRACDARCTGASGHNCECQCGGRNHGSDNR